MLVACVFGMLWVHLDYMYCTVRSYLDFYRYEFLGGAFPQRIIDSSLLEEVNLSGIWVEGLPSERVLRIGAELALCLSHKP